MTGVGTSVRLAGDGLSVYGNQGSTHPCDNNIYVEPIMVKIKRESPEGACVGQKHWHGDDAWGCL